ncbi:MAG: aromatic ring-hydroxylating dioxygenase subunit alpha [Pseudomonadota bacterium]
MLKHTEATLPAQWYFDTAHFHRELEKIWYQDWICVGHVSEWSQTGQFQRATIGDQQVLVIRDRDGCLRAFHNTCRHRGAELCAESEGRVRAGRLVCPYHGWAYGLDGALQSVPRSMRAADFDLQDYPLYPVAIDEWRGFVFINLDAKGSLPLADTVAAEAQWVERWPLEKLALAHREAHEIHCNWKVFWENYMECCHCPVVHQDLVRLVPHYGEGLNEREDLPDAHPLRTRHGPLKDGAVTWSGDGDTPLPHFKGLGASEQAAGMTFSTHLPAFFLVGHVDYVRTVRVQPLGPERTRLVVDWFLAPEALSGDLDVERLVAFGRQVVMEDAQVCEINQRGLHSRAHRAGVLTPPEYEIRDLHDWLRARLDDPAPSAGPRAVAGTP